MCRELAALNIAVGGTEYAQRILLSGVKGSLYDTKQHKGELMCRKFNAVVGAEHAYFFYCWWS